jgi:hypothetical protein
MNWLARLKKIETAPERDATEPTKPGFVGFVAPGMAPMQKTGRDSPAANDAAQVLALVAIGEVATLVVSPAVATLATAETAARNQSVRGEVRTETLVANDAVSTQVASPQALFGDPDRCAWPHSQAMTGREIDTFTARLARFTDKGLSLSDGEALADKLVARDRDADDRRLCLDCVHLAGHAAGLWRCKNWQRAGVAVHARDAQLSAAMVFQPQRCDGLKEVTP